MKTKLWLNDSWIVADITGQISAHISAEEIGNPSCKEDIKLVLSKEALLHNRAWECVRQLYGKPIAINCGYRSPTWNKSVGGTSNSLHLSCCAYDCKLSVDDALFTKFSQWCEAVATAFNTQCELGRYKWGLHIGFGKLDYTSKRLYTFDKR